MKDVSKNYSNTTLVKVKSGNDLMVMTEGKFKYNTC